MKLKDTQIIGFIEHKCGAISFKVKIKREDYTDADRECIKLAWREDGAMDVELHPSECCNVPEESPTWQRAHITEKPERSIWQQIWDVHEYYRIGYHEEWKKKEFIKHTKDYFIEGRITPEEYLEDFKQKYLGYQGKKV